VKIVLFAVAFIVSVIVVGIPFGKWIERKRLAEKRKRFMDRPSVPVEEIFRTHYAGASLDKEAVVQAWMKVAEVLNVDPAKLRPSDRFKHELGPVRGYPVPDELADLEEFLEHRCKELGIRLERGTVNTLDDFIKIVGRGHTRSV